jgi:hypothetical protein
MLLTAAITAVVLLPIAVMGADRFDDVPASNTFYDDIEWMAANGITRGCNPPANTQYCPDDDVTRGQMAAFMHRLASSQAVDAGTVQGLTPADLGNQAITGYEQVSVAEILVSGSHNISVSCPAGKKVLGGGINGPFATTVTSSYPSDDSTWTVEFVLDLPAGDFEVIATAICATG